MEYIRRPIAAPVCMQQYELRAASKYKEETPTLDDDTLVDPPPPAVKYIPAIPSRWTGFAKTPYLPEFAEGLCWLVKDKHIYFFSSTQKPCFLELSSSIIPSISTFFPEGSASSYCTVVFATRNGVLHRMRLYESDGSLALSSVETAILDASAAVLTTLTVATAISETSVVLGSGSGTVLVCTWPQDAMADLQVKEVALYVPGSFMKRLLTPLRRKRRSSVVGIDTSHKPYAVCCLCTTPSSEKVVVALSADSYLFLINVETGNILHMRDVAPGSDEAAPTTPIAAAMTSDLAALSSPEREEVDPMRRVFSPSQCTMGELYYWSYLQRCPPHSHSELSLFVGNGLMVHWKLISFTANRSQLAVDENVSWGESETVADYSLSSVGDEHPSSVRAWVRTRGTVGTLFAMDFDDETSELTRCATGTVRIEASIGEDGVFMSVDEAGDSVAVHKLRPVDDVEYAYWRLNTAGDDDPVAAGELSGLSDIDSDGCTYLHQLIDVISCSVRQFVPAERIEALRAEIGERQRDPWTSAVDAVQQLGGSGGGAEVGSAAAEFRRSYGGLPPLSPLTISMGVSPCVRPSSVYAAVRRVLHALQQPFATYQGYTLERSLSLKQLQSLDMRTIYMACRQMARAYYDLSVDALVFMAYMYAHQPLSASGEAQIQWSTEMQDWAITLARQWYTVNWLGALEIDCLPPDSNRFLRTLHREHQESAPPSPSARGNMLANGRRNSTDALIEMLRVVHIDDDGDDRDDLDGRDGDSRMIMMGDDEDGSREMGVEESTAFSFRRVPLLSAVLAAYGIPTAHSDSEAHYTAWETRCDLANRLCALLSSMVHFHPDYLCALLDLCSQSMLPANVFFANFLSAAPSSSSSSSTLSVNVSILRRFLDLLRFEIHPTHSEVLRLYDGRVHTSLRQHSRALKSYVVYELFRLNAIGGDSDEDGCGGREMRLDEEERGLLNVVHLFLSLQEWKLAVEAAQILLSVCHRRASTTDDDGQRSMFQRAIADLNSVMFTAHLHAGEIELAYSDICANPSTEHEQNCLKSLISTVLERGEYQYLTALPFTGAHFAEVTAALLWRARHSVVGIGGSVVPVHAGKSAKRGAIDEHEDDTEVGVECTPDAYDLLFGMHLYRSDYSLAASVMYEKALRYATFPFSAASLRSDSPGDILRVLRSWEGALAQCIACMKLLPEADRYLVRPDLQSMRTAATAFSASPQPKGLAVSLPATPISPHSPSSTSLASTLRQSKRKRAPDSQWDDLKGAARVLLGELESALTFVRGYQHLVRALSLSPAAAGGRLTWSNVVALDAERLVQRLVDVGRFRSAWELCRTMPEGESEDARMLVLTALVEECLSADADHWDRLHALLDDLPTPTAQAKASLQSLEAILTSPENLQPPRWLVHFSCTKAPEESLRLLVEYGRESEALSLLGEYVQRSVEIPESERADVENLRVIVDAIGAGMRGEEERGRLEAVREALRER